MSELSNTSTSTSTSTRTLLRHPSFQQLQDDVRIVQLLLRRNYAQHHRAKYFQRLQMVHRFLIKYSFVMYNTSMAQSACDDRRDLYCCCKLINQLVDARNFFRNIGIMYHTEQKKKQRERRQRDDQWDIMSIRTDIHDTHNHDKSSDTTESESSKHSRNDVKYKSDLLTLLKHISRGITHALPECLDRIEYASTAFFESASNGYFLPFCMTALAALARIRAILKTLGNIIVKEYHEMTNEIYNAVQTRDKKKLSVWGDIDECQHFMNHFTMDISVDLYQKYIYPCESANKDSDENGDDSILNIDGSEIPSSSANYLDPTVHNNDIGRSIGVTINSSNSKEEITSSRGDKSFMMKKKRSRAFNEPDSTQNITEKLQKKSKTKKSRTIESIFENGSAGKTPCKESKKKKKKKKKKTSGGDFFDNIFN